MAKNRPTSRVAAKLSARQFRKEDAGCTPDENFVRMSTMMRVHRRISAEKQVATKSETMKIDQKQHGERESEIEIREKQESE